MDFFIEDAAEKIEDSNADAEDEVLKGYITFVDVNTFKTEYLASMKYNDPIIRNSNVFSLKRDSQTKDYNYQDNSESKLR